MSQSESKPKEDVQKPEDSNTSNTGLRNQLKQVTQSDEIDLRALWESFMGFLRRAIKIAIKRGIILAVFLMLGGGLGYYFHQVAKPTYQTRMLIDAKIGDYSILSGLVGTLQDLADEENIKGLESTLKVNTEIAESIISVGLIFTT